jgi:DNA-binding transcriptional ArsR family regulator
VNTLFKALNDPTRREILEMLKEGDLTAGQIADKFHISKPSISHHLDLLKQADLVVAVKEGQFITYSINTTVLDEMLQWILQFSTKKKKS